MWLKLEVIFAVNHGADFFRVKAKRNFPAVDLIVLPV